MRRLRLFLLLGLTTSWLAAEVTLVRVWPGYRPAESFIGIAEYFGGDEPRSGRSTLRSQPEDRGGFYWLIRARSSEPVPDAVVEVQVVRPGRQDAETHRFAVELTPGSQAILAGLTGRDWGDPKERPTAWQVRVLDGSGAVLAQAQSFLWSSPSASGPRP